MSINSKEPERNIMRLYSYLVPLTTGEKITVSATSIVGALRAVRENGMTPIPGTRNISIWG